MGQTPLRGGEVLKLHEPVETRKALSGLLWGFYAPA